MVVLFRLGAFTLYTYGFFAGLAIFSGVFIFWSLARKEGFGKEKLLDLAVLSLAAALAAFKVWDWVFLRGRSGFGFFEDSGFGVGAVGFLAGSYFFLRRERWSILKIGDAAVAAFSFSFFLWRFGAFLGGGGSVVDLAAAFFYFFLFLAVFFARQKRPRTGFVFLFAFILLGFIFLFSKILKGRLFGFDALAVLALLGFVVIELRKKSFYLEEWEKMKFSYSGEFLRRLKSRLLRQKEKVEAEEKRVKREDPFFVPGRTEANAEFMDEASEELGHTQTQSALTSLSEIKKRTKKALARFKAGKYGLCEKCGRPIDKARLEAFPAATMCLRCEKRLEAQVKL